MKIQFRFIPVAGVLALGFWTLAPQVTAQTRLGLSISMSAGQAQITVKGPVGTACQVQRTDNLSATSQWVHVGSQLLASPPSPLIDPAPSSLCSYYRAIWTPNTNLVWISPGTFTMGSPPAEALRMSDEAQHPVTLTRGFWMGKYLVTQQEYQAVLGTNPSFFTTNLTQDLRRPVEQVSWVDATNYCALRTQQERAAGLIPSNYTYRLPTESEWEYACRAGTTTATYLGTGLHSGNANFDGQYEYDSVAGLVFNSAGVSPGITTPVGSYAANRWGLHDMIGNVWEWCQDWYDWYPTGPVTDPQGPATGSYHVTRGGSWRYYGQFCRSAQRLDYFPTIKDKDLGFRVVLVSGQ